MYEHTGVVGVDRDDLRQDAWVAMLTFEERHPGVIDRLKAAGKLSAYLDRLGTRARFHLHQRSARREVAECEFTRSVRCVVDEVAIDPEDFTEPSIGSVDRRLGLWAPLVDMYQAPPTSFAVISPEWATLARRFVRPHGAKATVDPLGVHAVIGMWRAGMLSHRETVMLFAPWCTARLRTRFTEPFLDRVALPEPEVIERVVAVLERIGVHADAAWNSAVGAATWVPARKRRNGQPVGALGSGRYALLMPGEQPVAEWLTSRAVEFEVQKDFADLRRNGRPLVFDFCIPASLTLIEVQDSRHDRDADLRLRDRMKRQWASRNGWRLLEVWPQDDFDQALLPAIELALRAG